MANTNPTSDTVTVVSADPFAILFFAGVGIYFLVRLFHFYKLYRKHKHNNEPSALLGVVYPHKDVH
jgi:hypothetical protein